MARQVNDIFINKPDDFVHYIVGDFLTKNGFVLKQKKGEQYWQEGNGFITAPKCFKYSYYNGMIHIEAWLKVPLLPGVYISEMNLEGSYGYLIKKGYKDSLAQLVDLLNQPLPSDMSAYTQPGMIPQPVMVQAYDTSNNATLGLIFGIISVPLSLIPLIGIILGATGVVQSKKGLMSPKRKSASAGMVLSVIGIVLSVIMWIINFIYTVN